MNRKTPRASWIWLIAAFCLVQALLFALTERKPSVRLTHDSWEYLVAARNWAEHGVFYCSKIEGELRPALYSKRTPAYPFALSFFYSAGSPVKLGILWQVLLNIAAAGLLWWLSSLVGLERRLRFLLLAVLLFYPPQLIYTQIIMAEVMLAVVLLLSVTLVAAYLKSGKEYFLALANLALGLGALTKPVLLYFWIPSLVYHGWLALRLHRWRIVVWALLPLIPIGAWCYRNYERTGYFHFSSMKAITLELRMRHDSGAERLARPEEAKGNLGAITKDVERAFVKDRLAHWPRTAWRHALGTGAFFLDPGRFDIYQILGLPPNGRLATVFIPTHKRAKLPSMPAGIAFYLVTMFVINVLVSLAFLHFLVLGRAPIELRVFVGVLVGDVALITGTMGTSRYRLDVEPLLLLGLPFFFDWLARRRATRNRYESLFTMCGFSGKSNSSRTSSA